MRTRTGRGGRGTAGAPPLEQGIKRQAEDGVEDLKEVVKNPKRHGKGPRGRPDIVASWGGTPASGQGEIGRYNTGGKRSGSTRLGELYL